MKTIETKTKIGFKKILIKFIDTDNKLKLTDKND